MGHADQLIWGAFAVAIGTRGWALGIVISARSGARGGHAKKFFLKAFAIAIGAHGRAEWSGPGRRGAGARLRKKILGGAFAIVVGARSGRMVGAAIAQKILFWRSLLRSV